MKGMSCIDQLRGILQGFSSDRGRLFLRDEVTSIPTQQPRRSVGVVLVLHNKEYKRSAHFTGGKTLWELAQVCRQSQEPTIQRRAPRAGNQQGRSQNLAGTS